MIQNEGKKQFIVEQPPRLADAQRGFLYNMLDYTFVLHDLNIQGQFASVQLSERRQIFDCVYDTFRL